MSPQDRMGYDPALAQLFASSVGPVQISQRIAQADINPIAQSLAPPGNKDGEIDISDGESTAESVPVDRIVQEDSRPRKRKRKAIEEDDIETRYMRQLALQEINNHHNQSAPKNGAGLGKGVGQGTVDADRSLKVVAIGESEEFEAAREEMPQHETISSGRKDTDIEKASKTIFLANVSTSTISSKTAKKKLMSHLTSFFPSLPESNVQHAIESFRFRSTAFAESGMPRKAAFIKQELMDTTTKSTNAYAVYTTQLAAREAVKRLNGTIVLDRHLRVDSVAHPAKQDHRRSVFVGNLSFVDDTTNIDAAKDAESKSKLRKGKDPADIEEGLWRQFGKAGQVESVRVVRDKTTRVGKGFAYVQFLDANSVEKALSINGKKFPPMLPRILRVTRAKSVTKTKVPNERSRRDTKIGSKKIVNKGSHESLREAKSFNGRANKLFGRAGAAQIVGKHAEVKKSRRPTKSSDRRAESFKKKAKPK